MVFPDGESPDAIAAANRLVAAGTAAPILLGDLFRLESKAREAGISLKGVRVLNPRRDKWREPCATALLADRGRALGLDREAAERLAEEPGVFAALTCLQGEADAVVARAPRAGGAAGPLGAGLALLGQDEIAGAAGCTVTTRGGEVRVWVDPRAAETSSEAIAAAARDGAALARLLLGRAPRVAVLGPATYGGGDGPRGDLLLERLSRAVEVARADDPDLTVDGPLELDVALDPTLQEAYGPTATLGGPADVLVAPEPTVARACVDLVRLLPDADALGPLLIGLRVPVCLTSQEGPEPLTLAAALASALHQARSRAATESALQTTLTDALQRAVRARTPRPPATRIEGAAQGAP